MIIKYKGTGELDWGKTIGGTDFDEINSVTETNDGGYIVGGYFRSATITLENGDILSNHGSTSYYSSYYDGMIIKYKSDGEVEWGKSLGGTGNDFVESIEETSDGGYIAGGEFQSSSITLDNGEKLGAIETEGMMIKYNTRGEVEWGNSVGGTGHDYIEKVVETSDGGYIIGGRFDSSTIILDNGKTLTNHGSVYDGMIIKYYFKEVPNIELKQGNSVGGTSEDKIQAVTKTSDGGYIVGGYFKSATITLENGVVLSNQGSTAYDDGMIIKYNSNLEVEWAKAVGGTKDDYIKAIEETEDGGYIAGGEFKSSSITLDNGENLSNYSLNNAYCGMIIKYSAIGEVEWGKSINGINYITSLAKTNDGGFIIGGYFNSSRVNLDNGDVLVNKGSNDGIIIKYNNKGNVEWGKTVGGTSYDYIKSVTETSDGGYIVGGGFGGAITLDNGIVLTTSEYSLDGMIIKYNSNGEVEWGKSIGGEEYEYISSVIETSDGGYILSGQFQSLTITLDNGEILTRLRKQYNVL